MEPSIRYANLGQSSQDAQFLYDLNENTKPEEFDSLRHSFPNYKLEGCFGRINALGGAAEKGNLNLIDHLVTIGGKDLLNIGDANGVTALFYCIYQAACGDNHIGFLVSEKAHLMTPTLLCELGTDINLAITFGWTSSFTGDIPPGVTALWLAAEKTNRLDLVKMLIRYGGDEKVCGELSEKGKAMISQGKIEIFNENKELMQAKLDQDCAFSVFPKEIQDLIIMESFRVGRWRPFLLKA